MGATTINQVQDLCIEWIALLENGMLTILADVWKIYVAVL